MTKKIEDRIEELEAEVGKLKSELKKNKVLVSVVLDESGSMASCKGATIDGFNEYVDTLLKDKETEYRISLTKFDSFGNRVLWENAPVTEKIRLTHSNFTPNGGTPLYDALGDALESTKRVAKGTNVVFVVLTDGGENASRRFKSSDIQAAITDRTKKDDWTFMYIGANQDAWSIGNSLGIQHSYNFNTNYTQHNFSNIADMTLSASASYAMAASPVERDVKIKAVRGKYKEDQTTTDAALDTSNTNVVV